MQLDELEQDALLEAFNLGAGRAAGSLEAMIGGLYEIRLSVPSIEMLSMQALADQLVQEIGPAGCGVSQSLSGAFQGKAMLIYSEAASLGLVKMLLDDVEGAEASLADAATFSQLESDAFLEVGNVVLNACLGSLGNQFGFQLDIGLPSFHHGSPEEILGGASGYRPDDSLIHLKIDFSIADRDLSGHIGFFLDVAAKEQLRTHMRAYLRELGVLG